MTRGPGSIASARKGQFDLIDVPGARFFALAGQGAPESDAYQAAVQALYTIAYTARFKGKALGHDEKVAPLEGLWWADDHSVFVTGARDAWRWRMLICAPSWVDAAAFAALRPLAQARRADRPEVLAAIGRVELVSIAEGACLQALHVGPYADEAPLIARLHAREMPARGLVPNGPHHEIYLSDPSRTAPEKLKTLIRQPVRPA